MKITLRTNPDRSGREATFKEEEIHLTGGVLAQITSLLDFADSEFRRYTQNDEKNGGRSRWDWWRAICQTTWAEIKFFPKEDADESFDLWLRLEFPIIEGKHHSELGLAFNASQRVGRGAMNLPSIGIWYSQDRQQELLLNRDPEIRKKLNPDVLVIEMKHWPFLKTLTDQDVLSCVSLLLASLEAQVIEVSEKLSRKALNQTAPQ